MQVKIGLDEDAIYINGKPFVEIYTELAKNTTYLIEVSRGNIDKEDGVLAIKKTPKLDIVVKNGTAHILTDQTTLLKYEGNRLIIDETNTNIRA